MGLSLSCTVLRYLSVSFKGTSLRAATYFYPFYCSYSLFDFDVFVLTKKCNYCYTTRNFALTSSHMFAYSTKLLSYLLLLLLFLNKLKNVTDNFGLYSSIILCFRTLFIITIYRMSRVLKFL